VAADEQVADVGEVAEIFIAFVKLELVERDVAAGDPVRALGEVDLIGALDAHGQDRGEPLPGGGGDDVGAVLVADRLAHRLIETGQGLDVARKHVVAHRQGRRLGMAVEVVAGCDQAAGLGPALVIGDPHGQGDPGLVVEDRIVELIAGGRQLVVGRRRVRMNTVGNVRPGIGGVVGHNPQAELARRRRRLARLTGEQGAQIGPAVRVLRPPKGDLARRIDDRILADLAVVLGRVGLEEDDPVVRAGDLVEARIDGGVQLDDARRGRPGHGGLGRGPDDRHGRFRNRGRQGVDVVFGDRLAVRVEAHELVRPIGRDRHGVEVFLDRGPEAAAGVAPHFLEP
jgi:hypothetical protein